MAKGLSRAGHIDISAAETPAGLDIQVECDGEIVTLFPKKNAPITAQLDDVMVDMTLEVAL